MSKGSDMLHTAADVVAIRGKTYGPPKKNMQNTALLWEAILGVSITPAQVAMCMIAVKMSRLVETPDHADSVLDIAGYAAVLRDCQEDK